MVVDATPSPPSVSPPSEPQQPAAAGGKGSSQPLTQTGSSTASRSTTLTPLHIAGSSAAAAPAAPAAVAAASKLRSQQLQGTAGEERSISPEDIKEFLTKVQQQKKGLTPAMPDREEAAIVRGLPGEVGASSDDDVDWVQTSPVKPLTVSQGELLGRLPRAHTGETRQAPRAPEDEKQDIERQPSPPSDIVIV